MAFQKERGMGYCGLACVLCSHESCTGCKQGDCPDKDTCGVYRCCGDKGLDGCYACPDYLCQEGMLQGIRTRAFHQYAQTYGTEALLKRLHINDQDGINYHRGDSLRGDYDAPDSIENVLHLLRLGKLSPYIRCPISESEHYILRLVRLEDAEDLLHCYADAQAQRLFNADRCTSDFCYTTVEQMRACIGTWLQEYAQHRYIRLAIVDKTTGKAVGSMEMFSVQDDGADAPSAGVWRLDLRSAHETAAHIQELCIASLHLFATFWDTARVVTKAIPAATERLAALAALGFVPTTWRSGLAYYHLYSK